MTHRANAKSSSSQRRIWGCPSGYERVKCKQPVAIEGISVCSMPLKRLFASVTIEIVGAEHSSIGTVGARGVLRRNYTGKKPVVIQHRSQDAVNYYDHENGAKIIKSSHFELDYTLGRKITFFCMAQGNPRPTITWFKDGAELYQHRFFQVHESHIDADIIKSKMEIDPTTQMDAGYYECQADNIYAIDRRGFRTDYVMINF
ncbi:CAVP-target protein-like isoform X1 [Rhagoletis pomonella]|uniref:CAVP-target protein-like isoform X1 n=1 Tax=Rhagoletis pomonella TaxID=28610 RepID=UPI00177E1CC6|nr:CAVP-target protein-like isoform X1 [Rhagoletis pomonella]